METAVRWSQSSTIGDEHFLFVEVVGKSFKLCQVKSRKRGKLKYDVVAEHKKVPAFRAFDWCPNHQGVVAVGQSSGEATVLRIDDDSQAVLSFPIRNQRLCNAIAFNDQGWLATGLDKVRTDNCLNVWDLHQQLPSGNAAGFLSSPGRTHLEPLYKLAGSEPITSIKFFRQDPRTLVTGVKGQFVRFYDLRQAPGSSTLQFTTRCVNNVAIDYKDENYIASCYPTKDPVISIWDRRAGSRPPLAQSSFFSASSIESSPLSASLELRDATEAPGSIWSLRFSSTRRGLLGLLSNIGHFKTYDIGREFLRTDEPNSSANADTARTKSPESVGMEELYLHGTQDLQHACSEDSMPKAGDRIVSFDFMNLGGTWNEPKAITLTENGKIAELSIPMVPEPELFSSVGLVHRGKKQLQRPADLVNVVGRHRSKSMPLKRPTARTGKPPGATELVTQFMRCVEGYLFSAEGNRIIARGDKVLKQFWSWLEWAGNEQLAGASVQDGLDFSFLGVYALWMNDCGSKSRANQTSSPDPAGMSEAIGGLVQRLNIPAIKFTATDYPAHRLLCLRYIGEDCSSERLEETVTELVSRKQHIKAAALALFADEARLAHRALRNSSIQFHKMLAMALAGASKRATGRDEEAEGDWAETIESLASDLTDPFASAILAYVKDKTFESVIQEEGLPIRQRIALALRWLDDQSLTKYISRLTKWVIAHGDLEGVLLTGLGTDAAVELFENYLRRCGDLQTTVLALTWTIPRYVDDPITRRKFLCWRDTYRQYMNSWNLHFDRADFDIASSKIAVDASGQRLWQAANPQLALTCGYCNRGVTQFAPGTFAGIDSGAGRRAAPSQSNAVSADGNDGNSSVDKASTITTTHRTQRHRLLSEKAAAVGTVCPKCGRRLPRCGVCDLELGMPDPSFMRWSARNHEQSNHQQGSGNIDFSASVGNESDVTALGPKSEGRSRSRGLGSGTGSGSATLTSRSAANPVWSTTRSSKSASDPASTVFPGPAAGAQTQSPSSSQLLKQSSSSSPPPPAKNPSMKIDIDAEAAAAAAPSPLPDSKLLERLIAYCIKCNHGFHGHHALEWFKGVTTAAAPSPAGAAAVVSNDQGESRSRSRSRGHAICPVSECECLCELGI